MPDQVYAFAVTIPAGTPVATPQVTDVAIPVRIVRRIVVRIPPGPLGFMGFQIAATGAQIIPEVANTFIVANDEVIAWDVANMIQSGAFQVIGYNTGIYDHTVYVRFEVDVPQLLPARATLQPLTFN